MNLICLITLNIYDYCVIPSHYYFTIIGFEPVNSECDTAILERRLVQQQRNLTRTRQALSDAETNNILLQRQNDLYLQIARHFYEHIQSVLEPNANGSASNNDGQLSHELIESTQSLLQETRDVLFPVESNNDMDASFEMMVESDDIIDSQEDSSDAESMDDHPMAERRLRTISIMSWDE